MIFQEYGVFPWLTVRGNIEFGLDLRANRRPAERTEIVDRYMGLMGLRISPTLPKHLSGGMRQRLALARAYAVQPEFLLMDEPFGALDAQTRTAMQDLLLQVLRRGQDRAADHPLGRRGDLPVVADRRRDGAAGARARDHRGAVRLSARESVHEAPRFAELRAHIRDLVMKEYEAQARQRAPQIDTDPPDRPREDTR